MNFLFFMSIFRLYPGFEHNSVRRNLFLNACFCWDSRHSIREMDQKYKLAEIVGYGNSYLEFLIRQFKVFRLHAKLHDAARAVRTHRGKGLGFCYMIGRGPKSCLVNHATGLLFCLHLNLFLSTFDAVRLALY